MTFKQWVKDYGGPDAVAKKLRVTPHAVRYWMNRTYQPRIPKILKLVALSKNKLTVESVIRDTSN